ncbi:hypothetical protein [Spirillospora sp. NPDC029432]|uniref:hypothetical protein n=1 Tax=Spirillospora sp. NPDC029432 TaxID=3154599 RepID=UPI003452E9D0
MDIIGDALVQAFAERGYQAALQTPERLVVTLPGGTTGPLDIGEWRAFAGRNPRAELPEHAAAFVRGFVRNIETAQRAEEHSEIDRLLAEERLRVRLYTEEDLNAAPGMRDALVNRPLAPGLLETVVVDYPDSIMPLNRSSIGSRPEAEIFAAAVRASIEKEPHYVKTDEIWDVPISHIGETHRYIGAHVHALPRHLGPAPYGALVSFPVPEYLVFHEIGGTHLFAAMEAMQALTRTHFDKGEKAISPQVYWYRPGPALDLRPVGIQVDHEQKSIAAQSAETDELITLWTRDHS